jgi:hypothetical protein
MVPRLLHSIGVRSAPMHATSLGCVALCLSLWIRAKTVDQQLRDNAERRVLFVGLWPAMFWLIGDAVEVHEPRGLRRASRRAPRLLRR